jgi:anti-sigma regulatory factor (Ser/Thr protein kinase)
MSANLLEIGAVARQLGVAPSTLRTWERRYRLIVPRRGAQGQRLYDTEQVALLGRVLAQVRLGARARAAHAAESAGWPRLPPTIVLTPSPDAPHRARRAVDELLAPALDGRFAFNLRLVASELVNNAVVHGSSRDPILMDVRLYPDGAELELSNRGNRLRLRSLRARRGQGGRGLEIVDALAAGWRIESGAWGTTITVRLSRDEPAPALV